MGAILYLFLVLLLPFRQLLAPRQTVKDWRSISRQCAIIGSMIFIAWLETEIAQRLGFLSSGKLARRLPILLLGGTFLVLEIARWTLARKSLAAGSVETPT
jgi:hypothetical protein